MRGKRGGISLDRHTLRFYYRKVVNISNYHFKNSQGANSTTLLRKALQGGMMSAHNLLSYEEVLKDLPDRKHILIGNGFSIACDPVFAYPNLFQYAKKNGLTKHVLAAFDYLGTNNFEGVLRLLEDGIWIKENYDLVRKKGFKSSLKNDFISVKNALVAAITKTHLPFPAAIDEKRKDNCSGFLSPFYNIFTTNYDLLLYWVAMHGGDKMQRKDGFGEDPNDPDAKYLVFHEHLGRSGGILFIHGALHLYVTNGEVRKHSWKRSDTPIIELVKAGLEARQYPLFVAEGRPEKKLEQIQRSGYLSYCFGKLERIENALVVYGLAFGESDRHISNVIADNPKLGYLYVGLFENPRSKAGQAVIEAAKAIQNRRKRNQDRNRGFKDLNIHFYDSKTVHVWD